MKFTQIRHGSHLIQYRGKTFLIDPVFADKETMSALPKGRVKSKNPMVDLPFSLEFLKDIDGLILTHLHFDHIDDKAKEMLNKDIPVYCNEMDKEKIIKFGFKNVFGIKNSIVAFDTIKIETVLGGKHGTGIKGKLMGTVTGYILSDAKNEEPKVYIIGDSIWCDSVQDTLKKDIDVVIAFGGEARLFGGKNNITMSCDDIDKVALNSKAKIIVNHLDTWNHCYMTRQSLKQFINNKSYNQRILIPNDGETIQL